MDMMDLIRAGRVQRYFRATRKINIPKMVYHITQRAAGKGQLFLENNDYRKMLFLLKETTENYSLAMYAFCLMPNHTHFLLSTTQPNLDDAMRYLFSRYAMGFNKKYERKGHLFGGPYRQSVCLDDGYLLAASLYIHQNPVKAGLAAMPVEYCWSTCRLYCDEQTPKSFVNADFVLSLFPESELSRQQRYGDLLNRGSQLESGRVLEQGDAIEKFMANLMSIFPSVFKGMTQKRKVAEYSGVDLSDIDKLEEELEQEKSGDSKTKPQTNHAKKYLIEQLIARGYKREEIAKRMGVSRKTVYNILKS
jgi:putative transposase